MCNSLIMYLGPNSTLRRVFSGTLNVLVRSLRTFSKSASSCHIINKPPMLCKVTCDRQQILLRNLFDIRGSSGWERNEIGH